jgi:hypothetical protein
MIESLLDLLSLSARLQSMPIVNKGKPNSFDEEKGFIGIRVLEC